MSWVDNIRNYRRTRLPDRLYVPLALFLATAGLVNHHAPSMGEWFLAWLCAYLLVFQFRLWDDIADLEKDCRRQPDRVLCLADSLTPFYWSLVVTGIPILGILITWSGVAYSAAGYLLVVCLIAAWYQFRRVIKCTDLGFAHVLLFKYPLFVFLIGFPYGDGIIMLTTVAAVIVYETFIIYEIDHDRRYQGHANIHALFVVHILLLVGFWLVVIILLRNESTVLQSLIALAVVLETGVLVDTVLRIKKARTIRFGGIPMFVTSCICCFALVLTNYQ